MTNKEPRILIYDIETSPNLGYYFELYREGNIVWNERHWNMLSFSWKWLGENKTHVLALPDFKTYKKDQENDIELVKELWKLFDEADIVIAHNGNSFDQKKSNARFIYHKLLPPSPYKQIDTKLVAKRYFKFDSNKLDDLGDYLKIGRKMNTGGFGLWKGCMKGDKKSWRIMKDYNKQDVILLEKVYLAMLPYMDNHPNLALMQDKKIACPNCGSDNIVSGGFRISRVCKYRRWKCNDCGSWHQSPLEDNSQVR